METKNKNHQNSNRLTLTKKKTFFIRKIKWDILDFLYLAHVLNCSIVRKRWTLVVSTMFIRLNIHTHNIFRVVALFPLVFSVCVYFPTTTKMGNWVKLQKKMSKMHIFQFTSKISNFMPHHKRFRNIFQLMCIYDKFRLANFSIVFFYSQKHIVLIKN